MKKVIIYCLFLASCAPKTSEKINQTKSAFSQRCTGVNTLSWQQQIQGADAATTIKLISEITIAAEADAKKSENLKGKGKADLSVKSDLAKVINQNTNQSSKVSDEIWEQSIAFQQTTCLFLSLLDRKDIPIVKKEEIVDDIIRVAKAHDEYILNKNTKDKTVTQEVTNNGVNNGLIANNLSINTGRVLQDEEKTTLLTTVKTELSKPGGDFHSTIIYVVIPEGHSNPDEISIAADIKRFLRQEGCNVKESSFQTFMTGDCLNPHVEYKPGSKSMTIIVCLPPK